jgi:hypothetical protein
MPERICKNCDVKFKARRSSTVYCSNPCRIKGSIKNDPNDVQKWCNYGQHFVEKKLFSKCSKNPDGFQSRCKQCAKNFCAANAEKIAIKKKLYHKKNAAKICAAAKMRYLSDKDSYARKNKLYRENNQEKIKEFHKNYYQNNKEKLKNRASDYFKNNKTEILAKNKIAYLGKREKVREWGFRYRAANREKIQKRKSDDFKQKYTDESFRRFWAGKNKESRLKNPVRFQLSTVRYRSRKKNAAGTFTVEQWKAKLEYYNYSCYLCGTSLQKPTIEHRIPLSRGGTNWIANIAPACGSCNSAKRDKTEKEFREWKEATNS